MHTHFPKNAAIKKNLTLSSSYSLRKHVSSLFCIKKLYKLYSAEYLSFDTW